MLLLTQPRSAPGVMNQSQADGKRYSILAVGEVNIDLILSGLARLPEFGSEVLADGFSKHLGGCTANFAVFCARLQEAVALVSHVGRDEFGTFLIQQLNRYGVSTDHVYADHQLTTGVTVALSGRSDRAFVTYPGTIDSVEAEEVTDDLLAASEHMHVGSYFLQSKLRAGIVDLFKRARKAGVTISLDTGYDPHENWNEGIHEVLPLVDIFLPNEVEAANITGQHDLEAASRALAEIVPLVVVTLGEKGCLGVRRDEAIHVPAFDIEVFDTTCCGDAFNAGLLQAWRRGKALAECLQQGNAAGALVAGGTGNAAERLSPAALAQLRRDGPDSLSQ